MKLWIKKQKTTKREVTDSVVNTSLSFSGLKVRVLLIQCMWMYTGYLFNFLMQLNVLYIYREHSVISFPAEMN